MISTLKLAARITSLFIGLSVISQASAQAPDWKKIRVAVEGNYPPFSVMSPDGKLGGFDIDIARALCVEMKAECTLVQQEWDGMIPAMNVAWFKCRPAPSMPNTRPISRIRTARIAPSQ